jgi:L-seryl-tRNA(Ser) seleniumtransferase
MTNPAALSGEGVFDPETRRLFAELGTRPVINAAGAYTLLGGSQLSPGVRAAMEAGNRSFADMKTLFDNSGRVIAGLLGVEAAYITAGGAAALALSVAACLTRGHVDYLERLPDTEGIPNEILVQKSTRQKYDHCLTIPGARIVETGDEKGLTPRQLEAAIGPKTAAVHYFVPLQFDYSGVPSLESVVEVAHRHNLPVVVDAAGHTYPVDNMRRFVRAGADLVCYANKYFDAPHSTGLIVGKKEFVELAALNSFLGFETSEYHTVGRGMKVDRQEVFAVVAALKEWLALDHESRFLAYGERCERLLHELKGLPLVETYRISEREVPRPVIRDGVRLVMQDAASAERVVRSMREGEPQVWLRIDDDRPDAVNVSVAYCTDEELEVVIGRLRDVLGQS